MESALKLVAVLVTAPFWYRPLRMVLLEIMRVVSLPEEPLQPTRQVGNRELPAGKAFAEVSKSTRKTWAQDSGRVSNARWDTGRRPLRSGARLSQGTAFHSASHRSGLRANQTRFGSGGWAGGFGRR